jgi:hypothetical protein
VPPWKHLKIPAGWMITVSDVVKTVITVLMFVACVVLLLVSANREWERETLKQQYVVEFCGPGGHEYYVTDDIDWDGSVLRFTNALTGQTVYLSGPVKVTEQRRP